jgi:hypothetical protein
MLGADPLSLDPVSSSYRETAAFASRSEGGPITASNGFSVGKSLLLINLYMAKSFFADRLFHARPLGLVASQRSMGCPVRRSTRIVLARADGIELAVVWSA